MNQFQAPSFSILDVLRGMARRKMLMLFCLAMGIAAGFAVLAVFKPSYIAEARILLDNQATPYDNANIQQSDIAREPAIDDRFVASQVTVLQSDDLSKRVVKDLGLAGRPDFDPLARGIGTIKKFMIAFGFSDDPSVMTPEQRALKQLAAGLTVYPLPGANAVGIKFVASNGKTAADIANAFAEKFVVSTREVRSGTNDRAREWLSQQIATLQTKVVASDAAVEKYRTETGLQKGQNSTLGVQEISELNTQITLADAASSEAAAKAAEIRNMLKTTGSVDGNQDVLSSPTIQSLRQQQVSAERKVTELSATYLPGHPKMIAATKELGAINFQIRREALKIVEGLQGQANIAAARAGSLRKSLDALKGREGGAAQDEVKLRELEREAKANRDQLEAMMARYADSNTRTNLDLQPGFARIIQQASAPAVPYFPKSGPIMLLTSLAGLSLGAGLAFLFEIMAQAARLNNDAASGLPSQRAPRRESHPILEVDRSTVKVPEVTPAPPIRERAAPSWPHAFQQSGAVVEATASHQPTAAAAGTAALPTPLTTVRLLRSAAEAHANLTKMEQAETESEAIIDLAANLQNLRQSKPAFACAVAGIGAGFEVGTATVAVARALARNGMKTILVDLEASRPLIPDLLALPTAPGLSELIAGKADFTKTIQRDNASGLQFIRHGHEGPTQDALLSQRMETITKTLTGIYDMVLLHVGEATPNTLSVVRGCSAAILYAPDRRLRDAAAAAFTLKAHGIHDVSIVNVETPVPAAA